MLAGVLAPPAENGFVTHDLIRVMPTEGNIGLWLVFKLGFSPSAGVFVLFPVVRRIFIFPKLKLLRLALDWEFKSTIK